MARHGAPRVLPLAVFLAAVAAVPWARGPPGTLWAGQGCSALGRCCPGRDPTCAAPGPLRCFCDQACSSVRDCCADYARACPVVSCVVAEWSGWSRCAKPCQISYRVRRRHVLREPRNGGAPCPHLEEQAGCVEYRSHQGVECQQSLFPALVTTGSYGKERRKRGVPKDQEIVGYCVQFRLGPVPGSCRQVRAPHAQWTKYLTQGHTVCVRCEWPAQDARSQRCHGDGGEAGGTSQRSREAETSLLSTEGTTEAPRSWVLPRLDSRSCVLRDPPALPLDRRKRGAGRLSNFAGLPPHQTRGTEPGLARGLSGVGAAIDSGPCSTRRCRHRAWCPPTLRAHENLKR